MMPGPLLPILGPLLPAFLIGLVLRRWPVATAIGGLISALLLRFMVAAIPLQSTSMAEGNALFAGDEFVLLGRSLLLTEALRQILIFAYTGAALLFLLSAFWPQGPDFVPIGLATLSTLAFALQIEPFALGAVALLVAAALTTWMIQGGRAGSTLASLRYLILMALSLPAFLVAGWMLESQQLVLAGTVWRLILLALALLLAGFPFHIWIHPLFKESRPLVAVYVLALGQLAVVVFAYQLFQRFPAIPQNARFSVTFAWIGAISALVAALLLTNARRPEQLLAYLALSDIGSTILALSFGPSGIETALTLLFMRFISMTIAALGLLLLEKKSDVLPAPRFANVGPLPWGIILFAFGALSLAGFPLTPGFPGRWSAVSLAAGRSFWLALPPLLATAAGALGLMRYVVHHTSWDVNVEPAHLRTRQIVTGVLAAALGAGLVLAIFPQPFLQLASRLARLF